LCAERQGGKEEEQAGDTQNGPVDEYFPFHGRYYTSREGESEEGRGQSKEVTSAA
jgi:hypothetical protein